MNKQQKSVTKRGIEWTDFTWNVIGGCKHRCRWEMPDGSVAICYAEEVANALRSDKFYPQGFENHYYHPDRLTEPLKVKTPAKIFLDSMSDLMGHWVPDEQIEAVLDIARKAHWRYRRRSPDRDVAFPRLRYMRAMLLHFQTKHLLLDRLSAKRATHEPD